MLEIFREIVSNMINFKYKTIVSKRFEFSENKLFVRRYRIVFNNSILKKSLKVLTHLIIILTILLALEAKEC